MPNRPSFPSRAARAAAPLLAAAALSACAWLPTTASTAPALPEATHVPSQPRAIVRRLPDGALEVVAIVSPRGGQAGAVRIVRPGHRDFPALSALVADLRTGDAEPVPAGTALP